MAHGVSEKVIIHSKEAMFCLSSNGAFTEMGAVEIPPWQIKGSVGVGDAFCAGALYGIYQKMSDPEILEFASAAAVCNMSTENAVDGMRNKSDIMQLMQNCQRKTISNH